MPNAITHTQEYTVLPGVVRHTFIIFGLFTTPNLAVAPLTQNPGDATAPGLSGTHRTLHVQPSHVTVCVRVCEVEMLRVYGLADVLPKATFTINSAINSAYKSVMVRVQLAVLSS